MPNRFSCISIASNTMQQQLTPLPQILNQKKIRPMPLIVQVVCLLKEKDADEVNQRKYWIRVSDGHSMMNFLCKKSVNKFVLNLKTGDIVQFGETSWIPFKIDDELCFKVVTKEFRVLSHDKLKTPQKFWGAGPVPKGHHRQIDESLSDVSSDDNNDTSANNDNQRESIEMEQNDVQNGPGDNEEIATQIDDKQQTASDKQTNGGSSVMEHSAARVNSRMGEDSLIPFTGSLADPRLQMSSCSRGGSSLRDLLAREHRKNIGRIFRLLILPDSPPTDRRSWQKNIYIRDLSQLMTAVCPHTLTDVEVENLIRQILTSDPSYHQPVQRGGDRQMCAVRLNASEVHRVPEEFVETFIKANKISGDLARSTPTRVSLEEETSTCSSVENFNDLIEHLQYCEQTTPTMIELLNQSCCSLVFRHGVFFDSDAEYSSFKQSFFEDLLFVQELRKEIRGSMSATRRLYAVYGNEGTGMLYSNFFRPSKDSVPVCLSLLFHRIKIFGYEVTSNTCAMIAVYPASSSDDIEVAIQSKSVLFTAMDWHADDNEYLGPVDEVEVWTISGFIDPDDPSSCTNVDGWKFLVRSCIPSDPSFGWLPIPDNQLLIQPKRMQSTHQHSVQGHLSGSIRYVITIREVDRKIFEEHSRRRSVRLREEEGSNLRAWTSQEDLRYTWSRPSKPLTHGGIKSGTTKAVLSLLYPGSSQQLFALSKYLYDFHACFCWSCNSLVYRRVHDCQTRNPLVFGQRFEFEVGKSYTREHLVEKAFNGALRMEESFRSDADVGCTSIFLTEDYPGNDWSDWKNGIIYTGGAGGRKPTKKRKTSADGSVFIYQQVKPQVSKKNLAMLGNLHYKLPVDVMVQSGDSFVYLGPWYVSKAVLDDCLPHANGFSFYRFKLLSSEVYWKKMIDAGFNYGFVLNETLEKFLLCYRDCHVADDSLNDNGLQAANSVGPDISAEAVLAILLENIEDLSRMFDIDCGSAVLGRITAALNRFI